ncbi:lipopolysaccharide biosynthesis protein [uncultured Roseobacter sp.]|uniref:lipopolysaccharide biosynthesis protein n=1 Tax=uncultured Roseobacter sp. TaxID=114847 RepID=UPI002636531E|nr:lipopolysaccharide biosynthesis protein [uncultured Roseobacter sp.]
MIARFVTKLRDEPISGRLLKNLKWIFSSQIIIALLGLVYLTIAARALGAAGLGMLAILEAYARIVARLTHLEPWQAVIRHGSDALEQQDSHRFGRLIGLSVKLDLVGGLLAAAVVLLLAPLVKTHFGVNADWMPYAAALAVLFSLHATGISLLRLFDRFDILAKVDAGMAALRTALAGAVLFLGLGLPGFVAIFVGISLMQGALTYAAGVREMRRKGHRIEMHGTRTSLSENPGFLRLMINSNLAVILRQTTQRLDVLILAVLVTPTAVGYYHLARRCGEAALRIGRPINQAVYPELTKLAVRREFDRLARLVKGIGLGFAGVLAVVLSGVIWFIDAIVIGLFGAEFAPAVPVVTIQAVAVGLYLIGIVLGPTLLSLGEDKALVRVGALTSALFFALIIPLTTLLGVSGAALSHLICNGVWLLLCVFLVRRSLRALKDQTT